MANELTNFIVNNSDVVQVKATAFGLWGYCLYKLKEGNNLSLRGQGVVSEGNVKTANDALDNVLRKANIKKETIVLANMDVVSVDEVSEKREASKAKIRAEIKEALGLDITDDENDGDNDYRYI